METVIHENYLKLMSPEDRKSLGQMTADEAVQACDTRIEKGLHKLIELELHRSGICYFHQRMDKPSGGKKGWPDFTFCIAGIPFAIECKTATGRVSDEQTEILCALRKNGWNAHVVRSFEQFCVVIEDTMRRCSI